jgi:hypothetical protein
LISFACFSRSFFKRVSSSIIVILAMM